MTNCINCGAILKGDICEYCGTDYTRETVVDCKDKIKAKIRIGDKSYTAYLAETEIRPLSTEIYRTLSGVIHREISPKRTHKWTFIEY